MASTAQLTYSSCWYRLVGDTFTTKSATDLIRPLYRPLWGVGSAVVPRNSLPSEVSWCATWVTDFQFFTRFCHATDVRFIYVATVGPLKGANFSTVAKRFVIFGVARYRSSSSHPFLERFVPRIKSSFWWNIFVELRLPSIWYNNSQVSVCGWWQISYICLGGQLFRAIDLGVALRPQWCCWCWGWGTSALTRARLSNDRDARRRRLTLGGWSPKIQISKI